MSAGACFLLLLPAALRLAPRRAAPAATSSAAEGRAHPNRGAPLPFPPPAVDDATLDAIAAACGAARRGMRRGAACGAACGAAAETYVYIDHAAGAVVATRDFDTAVAARACPPVDIMLAAEHRSIGLCTDAAIYIHLLGARLLPGPAALPLAAYEAACPPGGTARMFLEAMHEEWLHAPGPAGAPPPGSAQPAARGAAAAPASALGFERGGLPATGALHIFAPNFENAYESDAHLHARMDLVFCKVRRCVELFTPYLRHLNSSAQIIFTGHTAIDPAAALAAGAAPGAPRPAPGAGRDFNSFLHVRGKSELKHTAELLDCWARHPGWPVLTVLGPLPNPQINLTVSKRYLAAPNIHFPHPGIPDGPNWPRFDPAPTRELSALQLAAGVHVCPSEREGYGLYIAEARAAGALVVATDHPPMNEQVSAASGVLIPPERTFSHRGPPSPALARYGAISASVSPQAICAAVERVLAMPLLERASRGAAARAGFDAERDALLRAMRRARGAIAARLRGGGRPPTAGGAADRYGR